ncbi:MAG: hypothetical protein P8163_18005 [Candidatus Thiodiazotropha sp.]
MYPKFLLSVDHRLVLINFILLLGAAVAAPPVLADDTSGQACAMTKSSDWGSGFTGEAVVSNQTGQNIGVWSVRFNADFQIDNIWNWEDCSSCHVGLGAKPEADASRAQLENIDCLVCHQIEYKRKKINGEMIPDTAGMSISMDDAASKLYPFKYKTSDYPLDIHSNMLIPLDTKVFFDTADANAATLAGLQSMIEKQVPGFNPGDRYEWVTTDTYQALNHQVGPKSEALSCESCHLTSARIELQGALGYAPRDKDQASCSSDCHESYIAQAWRFGQFDDFKLFHASHKEPARTAWIVMISAASVV